MVAVVAAAAIAAVAVAAAVVAAAIAAVVAAAAVIATNPHSMRIVSRTARSLREQKREKSLRQREAAGTLANEFPHADLVHIHLKFVSDEGTAAPAARTHALYPSAQAYFEFTCPHGDCDGSIEMNAIVLPLLRKGATQAEGTLHCPGTRTGDESGRPRCNQRVDYWIVARHRAVTRAAS